MERKTVSIRNIVIGEGMPKICVPIVGSASDIILEEATAIRGIRADIAEWRADMYDDVFEPGKPELILSELRSVLGDMPLLFTFRTQAEGGAKAADAGTYTDLCMRSVQTGLIDLIDVEAFSSGEAAKGIIECAHAAGVSVIASFHDFNKTPSKDEMLDRLLKMQDLNADIVKLAVMPQSSSDVMTLMAVTEETSRESAACPLVTISMGNKGIISRLTGEFTGSAITFGTVDAASAPGQISVPELKEALTAIHNALNPKAELL